MNCDRKIVLITRKTRLEELVMRYHSVEQARFYLEHLGADFADYQREHNTYQQAKAASIACLSGYMRTQLLDRDFVKNFLFGPDDVVIALGQDGLVANTLKYLTGQPLIGVNPDPSRYDGVLLPFSVAALPTILSEVVQDRRGARSITMAKATLSDKQVLYAVNDFFVGPKTHGSARYEIAVGQQAECQSSSGIIISTGLGSTAWMKSIVTGAQAIAAALLETAPPVYQPLPWNSDRLVFAVREPFPSRSSSASIVFGVIKQDGDMQLRSLMPEGGVIFSDGIEADYLAFNSGTTAKIGIAERVGQLVN